jgi:hypothetical protein
LGFEGFLMLPELGRGKAVLNHGMSVPGNLPDCH